MRSSVQNDPSPAAAPQGLRRLPSVERLVGGAAESDLAAYGRTAFTDAIRSVLAELRAAGAPVPDDSEIRAAAAGRLAAE